MIFPFGGESTREIVWPPPPPRIPGAIASTSYEVPIATCIDRAGVGRERHAWDKDARCVFCDRRRISKWRV